MKSLAIMVASITALSAGAACAAEASWYVQGNAGVGFESRLDATPKIEGRTGWGLGAAAGRDFGNGWRTDGEVLYLSAHDRQGGGKTDSLGGFVNGYYTFNRAAAWQPFIGAGVGAARVKAKGDEDTGLAYQLKVGLEHPINDRLTAELAYRYVGVADLNAGSGQAVFDGDYRTSAVTLGLRYKFGL